MSADTPRPVVLLAFANDQDAHLDMLRRERMALSRQLLDAANADTIQLCVNAEVSIDDLIAQVASFDGRLALFHYAGHANGTGLQLEATGTGNEFAHGEGLAAFLGRQASLHLVFLNGCATKGQVTALLAAGVPAVIATAVPIQDSAATEFAEQFYLQLARGGTIATAFATARDLVKVRYGDAKQVDVHRGLHWSGDTATVAPEDIWGLYVPDNGDAALDWRLPLPPAPPAPPPDIVVGKLNQALKDELAAALKTVGGKVQRDVEGAEEDDDDTGRKLAFAIVDAFPLPVGEQLRLLFAQGSADLDHLRQIVRTYEVTMQLLAYASLAQLWDARTVTPGLTIAPEHRPVLNSFLTLTADAVASFDHYALLTGVLAILGDNGIEPMIRESGTILAQLIDAESVAAHARLVEIKRLLTADIAPDQVEPLCADAAAQLGVLLSDLAFIALYKHSTIRAIAVNKERGSNAAFVHSAFDLDGVAPSLGQRTYPVTTDSRAVILQLDRRKGDTFLNLTPLVIDENAFCDAPIPKLRYFSHHDAGRYVFRLVSNPADTIALPDPKLDALAPVADLMKLLETTVFA